MRNLVLDPIGQALIEMTPEGSLSVFSYLRGMSIELDNVFVDVLAILHGEVSQLVLRVALRVVWAEVSGEFVAELDEVIHPRGTTGVWALEKVWLEPVKCGALEVRHRKDHLRQVVHESARTVLEVKLTLDEECAKL